MSLATPFIILLGILLPGGCSRSTPHEQTYTQVRALLDTMPERALAILDSIPSGQLQPGLDSARFILLHALAEDKCYALTTSDSTICSQLVGIRDLEYTTNYLRTTNLKDDLRQAYYIQGRKLYTQQYLSKSIISFLNAVELIDKSTPYFEMGLIYIGISEAYGENLNGKQAITYAEKAIDAFSKTNKSSHWAYSILNRANCHYNDYNYNQAVIDYNKVVAVADSLGDQQLYYEGIDGLGRTYFSLHNYASARQYFQILHKSDSYPDEKSRIYAIMAEARGGNIEWADSCGRNLAEENSPYALDCIDIETAPRSIIKKAYENNYQCNLNLVHGVRSNTLVDSLNEQYTLQRKLLESDLQIKNLEVIIAIMFAIILCFTVGIIIYRFHIRIRQQNEAYSIVLRDFLDFMESTKVHKQILSEKMANINNNIRNITMRVANDMNQRIRDTYEVSDDHKIGSRTKKAVYDLINDLNTNGEIFKDLEKCLNSSYDDILSRFRSSFPTLPEIDYRMYVLINAGFSSDAIAHILNLTTTNLSTRKHRLKQKIKSNTNPDLCAEYISRF